ncbi:IS5 family transposase [Deinococcus pimensis]|uniref:IS5 family transposase n=1 Tax=Deinococcus pimensis TaxID=309888 RepID=UPI003CCC05A3
MVETLVPDRLWHTIQPLLPVTPRPKGGGQFACPRAALAGIIYVLKEGIRWNALPKGYGFPSGVTCWRRLRDWQAAGVWQALHHVLLNQLHALGLVDLSRSSLDSASVPRPQRGDLTGRNPTDRGKLGTKRHLIVDRQGLPLAVLLTGANTHDSLMFDPLLDAVPPLRTGQRGRPRQRPDAVHADKAFDYPRCRRSCRKRHIKARIARRGVESSERLGRHRWVVKRTLSWLNGFRRLRLRAERSASAFLALHLLGCALICYRTLCRLDG